ncbi:hypothetical protein CYMTET_49687 [Cymbomonas tetramitiformis]|uniref:DUF4336 domain-containing protein n=1 Tax=Cymbomonas tetramitiformis TaxID=36881 RepID=A0AAE0BPS0_9CHLO|nr:hypothetical protein CYMTET_49687 [Cymbomonas tetramitiformis]
MLRIGPCALFPMPVRLSSHNFTPRLRGQSNNGRSGTQANICRTNRFAHFNKSRSAAFRSFGSSAARTALKASLEETWSNPNGDVLTELLPGSLWAAQRPFVWNGIDVGGKMGVVRLADGGLWVHSPVELDEALKQELESLGPVRCIVSPNFEHVKYAAQWIDAFPEAAAYACPGLAAMKPDISFTNTVGEGEAETDAAWLGEFEVAFFNCERNPFTGKSFFNEVVFFHKPTRTVFVTDVFWNYPAEAVPLQTLAWKQGMDKVYLPFYRNLMLRGRQLEYRSLVDKVLDWNFDHILPCHGTFITTGSSDGGKDPHEILSQHLLQGKPQTGVLT